MMKLLTLSLLFLSSLAFGQDEPVNQNPLTASGKFTPYTLEAGMNGQVVIQLSLVKGFHAYEDKFKLKVIEPKNLLLGKFKISPVEEFQDTFSKKLKKGVKDQATLTASFEIPEDFPTGTHKAILQLGYQACTKKFCLFPKNINVPIPFEIRSSAVSGSQKTTSEKTSTGSFNEAVQKGWLYAFLFVFLAGILTSFTPCIFPMIPITMAILGSGQGERKRFTSFLLSITYVLGIALTYSILGVLAAMTGALFGSILGNPIVVSLIAIVFVAMGLSMYGLYEINPPAFIVKSLGSKKTGGGFGGAFLAGLIAGIVASPCVGPVLVSILTYVAQTQNQVLGFWLLFTFALGLGQIFILLGMASNLTQRLPKSGPWMDSVKFIFGTTMIGAALYYLNPILSTEVFYLLLGLTLVLISSFFGAFLSGENLSPQNRLRKGLLLLLFICGAYYFVLGLGQLSGVSLNNSSTMTANQETQNYKKLNWVPYSDFALKQAAQEKKPVIIDFFADWCVACVELEIYTFVDPRIQKLSKEFTLLKLDATQTTPEIEALLQKFKVLGLPTILFISPGGQVLENLTLTGFEKADPFLQRMKTTLL